MGCVLGAPFFALRTEGDAVEINLVPAKVYQLDRPEAVPVDHQVRNTNSWKGLSAPHTRHPDPAGCVWSGGGIGCQVLFDNTPPGAIRHRRIKNYDNSEGFRENVRMRETRRGRRRVRWGGPLRRQGPRIEKI